MTIIRSILENTVKGFDYLLDVSKLSDDSLAFIIKQHPKCEFNTEFIRQLIVKNYDVADSAFLAACINKILVNFCNSEFVSFTKYCSNPNNVYNLSYNRLTNANIEKCKNDFKFRNRKHFFFVLANKLKKPNVTKVSETVVLPTIY